MSIEKDEFVLPDEIIKATGDDPRDLVIISVPKMAKSTIFGALTREKNALVWGLEKGGYEYITARKMEVHTSNETGQWESFQNYVAQRKLLLENKGKYDYLLIDGLSDLDALSEIGGTLKYMDTIIGKNFNRDESGNKLHFDDPNFRLVTSLPDGNGFQHTRKWFLEQIEIMKQISPYRIYAAHIVDKLIKENGKDQVSGAEIALTGQLKRIFSTKVSTLAKLVADGNKRYLSFDVLNDSILSGSRAPKLNGQILISEKNEKTGEIKTFWENIFSNK